MLMSTPLLKALPVVVSSGFLYQHDWMSAAATCQNWYHVWKEVEDGLPAFAKVEVFVEDISGRDRSAVWIQEDGLDEAIRSPEFLRQVFDKVNALRVVAKKGKTARARAEAALPVWGIDLQVAILSVWGPWSHNSGGICITFGKKKDFQFLKHTGAPYLSGRSPWKIRLDRQLRLWTGIRTWPVYDGQPLWP